MINISKVTGQEVPKIFLHSSHIFSEKIFKTLIGQHFINDFKNCFLVIFFKFGNEPLWLRSCLIFNNYYTHTGNRLSQISDTQGSQNTGEFIQRGNASYTYYANGNLKSDANEQIQNIVYQPYLNQPIEVELSDGRKIKAKASIKLLSQYV